MEWYTENQQYDSSKTYRSCNKHNRSSKYSNKLFNPKRSANDDNTSRSFSNGSQYDCAPKYPNDFFNEKNPRSYSYHNKSRSLYPCFHINNPKRQKASHKHISKAYAQYSTKRDVINPNQKVSLISI